MSMDYERFHDALVDSLGDSIREGKSALLGHPLTGEVVVPLEKADHPGLFYIHGIGSTGAVPTNPETDGETSWTSALLTPDKIPTGLLIYNAPVLVQRQDDNLWHITGLDGVKAAEFFFGLKDRPQRSIDISQIDYGLLRPTDPVSMKVIISRANYDFDDIIYLVSSLATIDFTDAVFLLNDGIAQAVRVDINPVTKSIVYTYGDHFADTLTHEEAFDDFYPKEIDVGLFTSGWVRLFGSMTSIDIGDIFHGQELYTKNSGSKSAILGAVVTAGGNVVVSDGEVVWF